MKLSAAAAVVPLLASNSNGSPLQSGEDRKLLLARQGPGSYHAITGPTGGVQPRMEIRDLEATGDMWNLFVLALTEFEAADQHDIASYYQIAGIHGMPWISWDGVGGSAADKDESERGYCPHASLLFATWHRPYLALFEQELQNHAKGIASQFPNDTRQGYQDVAERLRLPYWDWAKATPDDQNLLPRAFTDEEVRVTFPNSTTTNIKNPLYEYRFHPLDNSEINGSGCSMIQTPDGPVGGDPDVCDNSPMTIRRGKPTSNHAALDAALKTILPNQRRTLFNILSQWQNFNTFSNDGGCDNGMIVGSLESLHNPIHTRNFPGHMSPISVAGFDPMFWLHHANVDRQLALYQAIFPETYVESCRASSPTYTVEAGEMLDADSPLTPFHRNAQGDFWTSANSRNCADMNYTYPELAGNPSNESLVASITAQYDDSSGGGGGGGGSKKREENSTTPSNGTVFLVEVKLPLYGLQDGKGNSQPYEVFVYIDSPTENFVGMASTIGGKKMQGDRPLIATMDLTLPLKKAGRKSDDETREWLLTHLHWRVGLGDFEIPKDKIKGLEVHLISTGIERSGRDDVFDRWVGGYNRHGSVDE